MRSAGASASSTTRSAGPSESASSAAPIGSAAAANGDSSSEPDVPIAADVTGRQENLMKAKLALYWIPTALVCLAMIADGLANLLHLEAAERGLLALGYPAYFGTLIGAWKILGGVALLAPGRPRLKEWAYAGIVFDLTGALFSHLAAGDPAVKCLGATVYLALTITSWAMRPPSRVLGTLPAFGIFQRPCHSQERRLV